MVEKKLIHFNSDSDYQSLKDTINDHSIVFIKDSRKIVTHGKEYHALNWSILEPDICTDLSMFDIYGNSTLLNTANCYVIKEAGTYKFPLVYGNAIKNGLNNTIAYTKVSGTYSHDFVNHLDNVITSPFIEEHANCIASDVKLSIADIGDVFSDISLGDESLCKYVRFKVNYIPESGANGIISILNNDGIVIWSWHIWIWSDDLTPTTITSNTGILYNILPVNLASFKNTNKLIDLQNWLYLWGRPTPLPPAYENYSETIYNCIPTYGNKLFKTEYRASSYGVGIQNPSIFYKERNDFIYNWFGSLTYYNLWDVNSTEKGMLNDPIKTIYDPCPPGFKVPNRDTFTYFKKNIISSTDQGFYFKRNASDTTGIFFTNSGYRTSSGSFKLTNSMSELSGTSWTASSANLGGAYVLFYSDYGISITHYSDANGYSIRPVQE